MTYARQLVILNGLVPLFVLIWDAWHGQLGANGVNNALHITGIVSLVFLFLSLLITPVRLLTGWNSLIAHRRALGLFGFAYGVLHLLIYFWWDRMASLRSTFDEISQRRFLLVGAVALLLMLPLAITSTNAMIRKLGPSRWKLLHRLAYVAVALGVLHYYMLVKSDVRQPIAFAMVLTPLLGFRFVHHYNDLRARANKPTPASRPPDSSRTKKVYTGELLISQIHGETHDIRTIRFTHPLGEPIPFIHLPGQFMTIEVEIDGKKLRRSYTLASSPSQRCFVELSIKRNPNGLVSNFVHDHLRVGQKLRVIAPGGRFHFDGSSATSVLLIAGGVGITPIISMLRYLTDRVWQGKIYVVNAIRSEQDFAFENELRGLASRFANVRVMNFISQPTKPSTLEAEGPRWQIRHGRIDALELNRFVPDLDDTSVYMCGPDQMMHAVHELLARLGVNRDRVFTEEFISPQPSTRDVDGAEKTGKNKENEFDASEDFRPVGEEVQIEFISSDIRTSADPQQTVLEIAESAGVKVSWECRAGICGQCKLRCKAGRVHMETTDALSLAEQKNGWILACQSKALSDTLQIEA